MASVVITGLPGGGKSMVGVQQFHRELVGTPRWIVTNLAWSPGRTWEYIKQRYGADVSLDRVTTLTKEQTRVFYLHRGNGVEAPLPLTRKQGGDGEIRYQESVRKYVDANGVEQTETVNALKSGPVLYIIDEAHIPCDSEAWAENEHAGLFYLSQHRKLGDDIFLITQHHTQLHKSLTRLTAEYWRVTNYGSRVPFGIKLPDVFVIDVYTRPPSIFSQAIDTRTIRLDPEGLASTYNTAAGVGIVGQLADTQRKRRGIPWQIGVGIFMLVLLVLYLLPVGAGELFKATLTDKPKINGPDKKPALVALPPANNPAPPLRPPVIINPIPVVQHTSGSIVKPTQFSPLVDPPRIKWLVRKDGNVALGLHNGDTFQVGDGRLQVVGQFAVLDGTKIFRLPQ